MPDIAFDRFYCYQEMSDLLHTYALAYPDLISLESIGKSF